MTVTRNRYSTYEQQLEDLDAIAGLLLPSLTNGATAFFKAFPSWLIQAGNEESSPWSVVLPNPSLNLSLPYPSDELSLALAIGRGYTPDQKDVWELAERYSFPSELLDRPVTSLSGGERMLLSICKSSALSEATRQVCVCSPYFWLDSVNHAAVERLLDEHDIDQNCAYLLLLEGEEDATSIDLSSRAIERQVCLTWCLKLKQATILFPAQAFPRVTKAKSITFAAEAVEVELESPTLVLGPNGAGKTTLAKILAGMLTPEVGEVRAVTTSLTGRARILLQDTITQLFSQSVTEHLERVFSFDKERRKLARLLFDDMQQKCVSQLPSAMSGTVVGDRQWPGTILQCKLALVVERLMSGTPLLILDEPGWCLSRTVARAFVNTVVEVANNKNIAVAIISHQKTWWADICRSTLTLTPQPFGNTVIVRRQTAQSKSANVTT